MHINLPLFYHRTTKIDGVTLCFLVITWVKSPRDMFLKHEAVHVDQWKKQPFTFHFRYFYKMMWNRWNGVSWWEAYRNISYEIEARDKSRRFFLLP
jgi:hypothetical protein